MSEQKTSLQARMQGLRKKEHKKKAKVDVDQAIHDRAKAYAAAHGLTIVQVFEG